MENKNWWKGAVIYQIYPRSFADGNDDGIGDFKGIGSKMDYLKSLGIDAIWTSPIFKSPMKDFGYDVSDFRDTHKAFGTLEEFDLMVKEAHKRGLKFLIDFVPSHTSDKHPWFIESKSSKDNPKADWYVWADPKEDGFVPNNWLSVFGGTVWQWDATRCQYYMHNYLKEQPDLNWQNPEVVDAVLAEMEFWLKRGVDGFRLDVIARCMHDKKLRNNPPKPKSEIIDDDKFTTNPYFFQKHEMCQTWREMYPNLQKMRKLLDKYHATCVGEISTDEPLEALTEYTKDGDKLHMGYTFNLLDVVPTAKHIEKTVKDLEKIIKDGWACWSFSNHDVVRLRSRFGKENISDEMIKTLNALLLSLRGSVCVYQGDELGLPEAYVPFKDLQDPYGIEFWPKFMGRDGCRTPIPWSDNKKNNGFSNTKPWLPAVKEHQKYAVSKQENDQNSVLNAFRDFVKFRKKHLAIIKGDISFLSSPKDVIAFERKFEDQNLVLIFNLSNNPKKISINVDEYETIYKFGQADINKNEIVIKGASFIVIEK